MWEPIIKKGKVNDRKWELKKNNIVLATIYRSPIDEKFSLYVSSPMIFKVIPGAGITHKFDTFKDAQNGFVNLVKEKALPWCREIVEYFNSNNN